MGTDDDRAWWACRAPAYLTFLWSANGGARTSEVTLATGEIVGIGCDDVAGSVFVILKSGAHVTIGFHAVPEHLTKLKEKHTARWIAARDSLAKRELARAAGVADSVHDEQIDRVLADIERDRERRR